MKRYPEVRDGIIRLVSELHLDEPDEYRVMLHTLSRTLPEPKPYIDVPGSYRWKDEDGHLRQANRTFRVYYVAGQYDRARDKAESDRREWLLANDPRMKL